MSGRTTKRCPSPLHIGDRECPVKEFYRAQINTDGAPWCKSCRDKYKQLRARRYLASWWSENGHNQLAKNRARYAEDAIRRQATLDRNKAWRKQHPEYERERSARRRKENPGYRKQLDQNYREANRESIRERHRLWVQSNKDANREHHQRYNALRATRAKEAGGNVTLATLRARWDYYNGKCWMCGKDAVHMDHVKPISKGGGSWASNLRPACYDCNVRKSGKWPFPTSVLSLPRSSD